MTAESREAAEYDRQLVERAKAGDTTAFEEIVHRYRERMLTLATQFLHDRHDAEEVVQDLFVRVHRGLGRFRGDCSLATWLHRITLNLARNRYWYFHRRARHGTISMDEPTRDGGSAVGELLPSDAAPRREVITAEFTELVTACMQRMPDCHREILTMRTVLHQSYDDIAAALGIEVGTVKSRIARARGVLRTLMHEDCPEFSQEADPADWLETVDEARGC